eukprot:scaffold79224_cov17-Tisochrysis_lutea.AAC.3
MVSYLMHSSSCKHKGKGNATQAANTSSVVLRKGRPPSCKHKNDSAAITSVTSTCNTVDVQTEAERGSSIFCSTTCHNGGHLLTSSFCPRSRNQNSNQIIVLAYNHLSFGLETLPGAALDKRREVPESRAWRFEIAGEQQQGVEALERKDRGKDLGTQNKRELCLSAGQGVGTHCMEGMDGQAQAPLSISAGGVGAHQQQVVHPPTDKQGPESDAQHQSLPSAIAAPAAASHGISSSNQAPPSTTSSARAQAPARAESLLSFIDRELQQPGGSGARHIRVHMAFGRAYFRTLLSNKGRPLPSVIKRT